MAALYAHTLLGVVAVYWIDDVIGCVPLHPEYEPGFGVERHSELIKRFDFIMRHIRHGIGSGFEFGGNGVFIGLAPKQIRQATFGAATGAWRTHNVIAVLVEIVRKLAFVSSTAQAYSPSPL